MTENDQFTETERSNGRRWASEQIHIAGLMNILNAASITVLVETSVLKVSRSDFVGFGGGVRFLICVLCVCVCVALFLLFGWREYSSASTYFSEDLLCSHSAQCSKIEHDHLRGDLACCTFKNAMPYIQARHAVHSREAPAEYRRMHASDPVAKAPQKDPQVLGS